MPSDEKSFLKKLILYSYHVLQQQPSTHTCRQAGHSCRSNLQTVKHYRVVHSLCFFCRWMSSDYLWSNVVMKSFICSVPQPPRDKLHCPSPSCPRLVWFAPGCCSTEDQKHDFPKHHPWNPHLDGVWAGKDYEKAHHSSPWQDPFIPLTRHTCACSSFPPVMIWWLITQV